MEDRIHPDEVEEVDPEDVTIKHAMLGFSIYLCDQRVGAIEGIAGRIEHFVVEPHWQNKGIGRAALNCFIDFSDEAESVTEVTTNNAVHPAMEHLLETEGFEEQSDDIGWVKELSNEQSAQNSN